MYEFYSERARYARTRGGIMAKRNSYEIKKTMLLKIRHENLKNPNILTVEEKYRIGSIARCDSVCYLTQLLAKFNQPTNE